MLCAPSGAFILILIGTVIVVPSEETVGVNRVIPVPLNVTVTGGVPVVANFVPVRMSEKLVPWAPLPGITADRRGLLTVKVCGLLRRPFTATVTGPSVALAGTVTVSVVDVAAVTVADTRVPLNPAKVTE